jgi:hypothetical protein
MPVVGAPRSHPGAQDVSAAAIWPGTIHHQPCVGGQGEQDGGEGRPLRARPFVLLYLTLLPNSARVQAAARVMGSPCCSPASSYATIPRSFAAAGSPASTRRRDGGLRDTDGGTS